MSAARTDTRVASAFAGSARCFAPANKAGPLAASTPDLIGDPSLIPIDTIHSQSTRARRLTWNVE
jgi:hypothetical protein